MSDTCEVVKIKSDNEQGFIFINKSDLKDESDLFIEGQINTQSTKKVGK